MMIPTMIDVQSNVVRRRTGVPGSFIGATAGFDAWTRRRLRENDRRRRTFGRLPRRNKVWAAALFAPWSGITILEPCNRRQALLKRREIRRAFHALDRPSRHLRFVETPDGNQPQHRNLR